MLPNKILICSLSVVMMLTSIVAYAGTNVNGTNVNGTNVNGTNVNGESVNGGDARCGPLHPQASTIDGAEGVWFPHAESECILRQLQSLPQRDSIELEQAQALVMAKHMATSATTALSLERLSESTTSDMLKQCQAALSSESDRCESFWRQPMIPLIGGLMAGAAICIGTAKAQK